jgi:hypothetical protein
MNGVLESKRERGLDNVPREVTWDLGYDVEPRPSDGGPPGFIEVGGRTAGADAVSVTRNEMKVGLNEPDQFILGSSRSGRWRALRPLCSRPFDRQSGFGEAVAVFRIPDLLTRPEAHVGGQ